jgi:hypothetical protein
VSAGKHKAAAAVARLRESGASWGSADAGAHSGQSESERLEEAVHIAEWQAAEAERERRARDRLAELTGDDVPAQSPPPEAPARNDAGYPTPEQCRAKEAELRANGDPHGYGSIGKALGVGRDVVRRRMGRK